MGSFYTVCKTQDVLEGEGKTVCIGTKLIALFRRNGEIFAIDDVCPHMGASLAGGLLENDTVTCSWHGWRFRITDGTWADNPRIKIGSYPVRLVGDDVQVEFDAQPGSANRG